MGEQSYTFTSGQVFSPIMRISRGRVFLYAAVIGAMFLTVFLLRNAHSNVKTLEGSNAKCQQKHDSLAAQLQVVYEQKNRLEKSLQQEKIDSQSRKKDLEKKLQEEETKNLREKEKVQTLESELNNLKSKFAVLENDKKLGEAKLRDEMEGFHTQKDEEINKLQVQISDLLEEKSKLTNTNSELGWKIKQHMNEASLCQVQLEQLIQKLSECSSSVKNRNNENGQNSPQESKKPEVLSVQSAKDTLHRPRIQDEPDIAVNFPLENVNVHQKNTSNSNVSINFNEKSKKVLNSEDVLAAGMDQVYAPDRLNESENLPQVQPPAAERGEYNGPLPDYDFVDEQLEQPDFNNGNDIRGGLKRNNFIIQNMNNNNVDAAQVRDMLDKSPGDVNEINGNPPINIPPPHDQRDIMAEKRIENNKQKPYAVNNHAMIEKNYVDEDEDDQGDNDDDRRILGVQQKVLQENDFADQDSLDNHGRHEEGVMVHPK